MLFLYIECSWIFFSQTGFAARLVYFFTYIWTCSCHLCFLMSWSLYMFMLSVFKLHLCVLFFTYILKPHTFPGLKVNQFLVPSFELNRNLHSFSLFKKLLCLSPIHPHQNEYIHYWSNAFSS